MPYGTVTPQSVKPNPLYLKVGQHYPDPVSLESHTSKLQMSQTVSLILKGYPIITDSLSGDVRPHHTFNQSHPARTLHGHLVSVVRYLLRIHVQGPITFTFHV